MQRFWVNIDGLIEELCVPADAEELMPGVRWGAPDHLFTPAFWKYQCEVQRRRQRYTWHRIGDNLLEEIAACLLGGFGIPAEMGMMAFARLKHHAMLLGTAPEAELRDLLSSPFRVGGRERRYRFATQKAAYLSRSLAIAKEVDVTLPAPHLRDVLASLPGIGLKTASWIVRNHLDSDEVAIIDVHLHRACVMMGVFEPRSQPGRDYLKLEGRFLNFSRAMETRASVLDAIIWDYMRRIGPTARGSKASPQQLQLAF
ncbi:MAG: hypothetical protein KF849_18920 [Rhizobiaceae bacterium]|nr:hypothetical protein [Rhizobiaceae bacterium]